MNVMGGSFALVDEALFVDAALVGVVVQDQRANTAFARTASVARAGQYAGKQIRGVMHWEAD